MKHLYIVSVFYEATNITGTNLFFIHAYCRLIVAYSSRWYTRGTFAPSLRHEKEKKTL